MSDSETESVYVFNNTNFPKSFTINWEEKEKKEVEEFLYENEKHPTRCRYCKCPISEIKSLCSIICHITCRNKVKGPCCTDQDLEILKEERKKKREEVRKIIVDIEQENETLRSLRERKKSKIQSGERHKREIELALEIDLVSVKEDIFWINRRLEWIEGALYEIEKNERYHKKKLQMLRKYLYFVIKSE